VAGGAGNCLWIATAGMLNFDSQRLWDFPSDAFSFFRASSSVWGRHADRHVDYGGYNNRVFFRR